MTDDVRAWRQAQGQGAAVNAFIPLAFELGEAYQFITRPALAKERLQTNAAGQVVLNLKTPWRDGTMDLVMSPLEFMQRRIEWQLCGSQICECQVG